MELYNSQTKRTIPFKPRIVELHEFHAVREYHRLMEE